MEITPNLGSDFLQVMIEFLQRNGYRVISTSPLDTYPPMTGEKLKQIREKLNMTQTDFGYRIAGICRHTISNYERGKQPIPRYIAEAAEMMANGEYCGPSNT